MKAREIKIFNLDSKFNSSYCFLIDMSIHAGKKRFFVYNINKDSIEASGLVTHGSGKEKTPVIKYSNNPGSYCTSLGKYRISTSYQGKFGLAYKLHGLDKTNNNAFERFVVLHSHSCVPDSEPAPVKLCESQGCPTVSPAFLNLLSDYIDKSPKPVLLWIYN